MKKLLILGLSLCALNSCENEVSLVRTIAISNPIKSGTPDALITEGSLCWKASPIATTTYSSSNVVHNSDASKITKAKFEKDGSFKFLFGQVEIDGTIVYGKNKHGKNILTTHATKYIAGSSLKEVVTTELLKTKYSNTYLWERVSFPGMPSQDFLLLVDLDAHPEAAAAKPGSVDRNWISKFYIR